MKRLFLWGILLLQSIWANGQLESVINIVDTGKSHGDTNINHGNRKNVVLKTQSPNLSTLATYASGPTTKPQVFNSGFIDFQNSGQMNASARVFKLYIGEPGKFMLPLSVYSGVSGNNPNSNIGSGRGSEQMILGLINPMSGVFNISTENTVRLRRKSKSLTGFSTVYQLGEKMISGQQAFTFKAFNFFSTYANSGILFQTGAWEKDKEKNMGVFWLLFRYHAIRISNSFEEISGYPPRKGFFTGYSIGVGIEINNVLNIKSYYYRYIDPGAAIFDIPIFQLTFNYSMKPTGQ
jgi:hypothetical protein